MSQYFFKVLIGEWKNKLRIPRLFVSSFSLTPRKVILIDASTKGLWRVDIEKEEDNNVVALYFKMGWTKFVKDNDLEDGDFLIFKFDGNSRFKVVMCGKSACVKKLESQALLARINQNNHKQQRQNKRTASTMDRGEHQKGKDSIPVKRQKVDATTIKEEEIDDDYDTATQAPWDDEAWTFQSEDEGEYDGGQKEVEEEEEESDVSDDIQHEPCYSAMNIGEGSSSGSIYPSFAVQLQHAYANKGCMCIPTDFFKEYIIRKEKQVVVIETERGVWKVTLLPHMKKGRIFARFSKGWSEFARMNGFETGQMLHFEMIQSGDCPKFIAYLKRPLIKL